MFTTKIDDNPIGVVFQHQRAAHVGQLTRPEVWIDKQGRMETKRVAVRAVTYVFFNECCVGVAYCSYGDQFSRETGRRIALRNALTTVLKRSGRNDRVVAEERAQVWEDYFLASTAKERAFNPLVMGRALRRMANKMFNDIHTFAETLPPMPTENDAPIPWKLSQPMTDEVIDTLNEMEER